MNGTAEREGRAHGVFDHLSVEDREGARRAQTHRAD